MMKKLCLGIVLIILMGSCASRKLVYLDNIEKEDDFGKEYINKFTEKRIEPNDKIYIRIYSLDEKTMRVFDEGGSHYMASIDPNIISYKVDSEGYIDFPFIGAINIKGLTLKEAKEKITENINQYLNNTDVIIRFMGNDITVLGEVEIQGKYKFYEDRITIFSAVGLAGGINKYGNKKDITLIRRKEDITTYHAVDLTDKNIARSEYYYVEPNDVLIVNPVRAKFSHLRSYSFVSIVLSGVTTLIAVLYYFR